MDRNEPGTLPIPKARNGGFEELMGPIEMPNAWERDAQGPLGRSGRSDQPRPTIGQDSGAPQLSDKTVMGTSRMAS